jgi:small subunit ribosomal protein S8
MSMSDPIADLLTRIRNANQARKPYADAPASHLKGEVLRVLREARYIDGYDLLDDQKQGVLRVHLKYTPDRERVITGLRRISRPGLRKYVKARQVPRVLGGLGVAVISTPKGVMTDEECRREKLGGEVICYVW